MFGDCNDDVGGPESATGRLRGGGSTGSSFKMFIILERLAGAALGGSVTELTGVELGRVGSLGALNKLGKRASVGE
jgi:hypothetical protein